MSISKNKRIKELLSGASSPLGGSTSQPMMIENPLVIIFGHDDKLITHIHPRENDSHRHYGLMVCDLVRHLAKAFKVHEDEMWKMIDMERNNPTTTIDVVN